MSTEEDFVLNFKFYLQALTPDSLYRITSAPFGSLKKYTLHNSNGHSRCSFVPGCGGNILELQLESKGRCIQIVEGFKTEAQLTANEKSRNIHLLPFPNRIRDGRYVFEGKEYRLPINKPKENNAIHGFIWNRPFEVVEEKITTSAVSVILKYNYTGDSEGFPFPFTAAYEYELSEAEFSVAVSVINAGKTSMPLGIGWHPYFTFHQRVDDLSLQLPACNLLEADERLIPTGRRTSCKQFNSLQKIGTSTFDTAFELTGSSDYFETSLCDSETNSAIILRQDASFRYLQVYIPSDRGSIALEPMTCPANAFNSGEGLIILRPGERHYGNMKIVLC